MNHRRGRSSAHGRAFQQGSEVDVRRFFSPRLRAASSDAAQKDPEQEGSSDEAAWLLGGHVRKVSRRRHPTAYLRRAQSRQTFEPLPCAGRSPNCAAGRGDQNVRNMPGCRTWWKRCSSRFCRLKLGSHRAAVARHRGKRTGALASALTRGLVRTPRRSSAQCPRRCRPDEIRPEG